MSDLERKKRRENLTFIGVILLAVFMVLTASAYRFRWFPFAPPKEKSADEVLRDIAADVVPLANEDVREKAARARRLIPADRARVNLMASGNEKGYYRVERCVGACSPVDQGGITRYATYMAQKAVGAAGQFRISAGNALSAEKVPSTIRRELNEKRAQMFMDFYRAMKYQVINVGPLDFSLGREWLERQYAPGDLPLVSANLVDAETNNTLFRPYLVVEQGGLKVAFIGVTPASPTPETAKSSRQEDLMRWHQYNKTAALDPALVLPVILKEIEGAPDIDLVVILSSCPVKVDVELMHKFGPQVDLFINASGNSRKKAPGIREGGTIIYTGEASMELANIEIYPGSLSPRHDLRYLFQKEEAIKELADLNNRLRDVNTMVKALENQLEQAKDKAAWEEIKQELVSRENVRKGIYDKTEKYKRRVLEFGDILPEKTYYWMRMQGMTANIAPDATLEARFRPVIELLEGVSENPRYGGVPREFGWGLLGAEAHHGNTSCRTCHDAIYTLWQATGHSLAYRVLMADDRKNEECLTCHVTGWRRNQAAESPSRVGENFGAVGCESCHGPGLAHARQMAAIQADPAAPKPVSTAINRKVNHYVCQSCHSGFHGKPFDYETALEKVSCTALAREKGVDITPKPPKGK